MGNLLEGHVRAELRNVRSVVYPSPLAEEQHRVGRYMRYHALRRLTNPALCAQGVVRRLFLLRVEPVVGLLHLNVEGRAVRAGLEDREKSVSWPEHH